MLAGIAFLLPAAAQAQPSRSDGERPRGQGGGPPGGRGNPGGGQGRAQPQPGGPAQRPGPAGGPPRLGADAQGIARGWQAANPGWSPRPLPPGQMRQLARGRPLPPGIARQAVPPGLLAQLPVHPGHTYAMVGTSLVLLGAGGIVVDILGLF